MGRLAGIVWKMCQYIRYYWLSGRLIRNAQSASRKRSSRGVMNIKSSGIFDISGISLDKKYHGSIRIARNSGLEKESLI